MAIKIDDQQRTITTSIGAGLVIFKTLFGGIWLFVGGIGVYSLLTGGEVTVNGRPGTPADVWLPGIFAVIGFVIFAFRYRRKIDLADNTVTRRWGFLLLLFGGSEPLAQIKSVKINKEIRRTKNGSYTIYVVDLALSAGEPLKVDENRDKQKARSIAEQVAKLCRCSIVDKAEGGNEERSFEQLDQPLIEREQQPSRRPPLPEGIEREQGTGPITVLILPSGPIFVRMFVALVPLLFATGFWWFFWYDPTRGASGDASVFLTVFNYAPLIMFGIPALIIMSKALGGPKKVCVKERKLIVGGREMPISELEELVISGKGLEAHSDRLSLRFAQGCNQSQLTGLREYLLYEFHTNR